MSNCKNCRHGKPTIVEALQRQMDMEGFISNESIAKIANELNTSESEVYGVATFYSQFSFTPKAKYNICLCTGTTCFVLGADKILDELKNITGINENETSKDGKWNISTARCLGCCGLAPVMTINGKVYGNLKVSDIKQILEECE
ncbi:MAG: NAD(P)H-dependent oxidoreductase subunit E [Clostridia bacterium]|nr:NAD(P)H-dependent oxidoreductase subunit E [Clostridia bacterium]